VSARSAACEVFVAGILGGVVTEVGGWVWEANVGVALRQLAFVARYELDPVDLQTINSGLATTDADADRWYTYPFVGEHSVDLHLAVNPGAAPVSIRVTGQMDEVLAARIETILSVLADIRPD